MLALALQREYVRISEEMRSTEDVDLPASMMALQCLLGFYINLTLA